MYFTYSNCILYDLLSTPINKDFQRSTKSIQKEYLLYFKIRSIIMEISN